MNAAQHPQPLAGVRILEVGVWYAGPGASAILAELGAEVIKIEDLTGDPVRHTSPVSLTKTPELEQRGWTVLWDLSNRGKKAISIDLHTEQGRSLLKTLVTSADVFLTNLRHPSHARLGIDYPTLSAAHPQLIHVNMSGYGREGDLAGEGSFDTLGQALSGMMAVAPTEEPTPLSLFMLDHFAAIAASHAILTALVAKSLHGEGQEVNLSLLGSALWLMQPNLINASLTGQPVDTGWDRSVMPPTSNTFRGSDGKWFVGVNPFWVDKEWANFTQAIGRPELATDPRYATADARVQEVPALNRIADAEFEKHTRDEWLEILGQHNLRFAPVLELNEALTHPQAIANGYVVDIDHPVLGPMKAPAYPVSFSKSAAPQVSAAPVEIGQDTVAVLEEAGLQEEEISRLVADGIVGLPQARTVRHQA